MERSWFPQFVSIFLSLIKADLSFQTAEPTIIPLSCVRSVVNDFSHNNFCKETIYYIKKQSIF